MQCQQETKAQLVLTGHLLAAVFVAAGVPMTQHRTLCQPTLIVLVRAVPTVPLEPSVDAVVAAVAAVPACPAAVDVAASQTSFPAMLKAALLHKTDRGL